MVGFHVQLLEGYDRESNNYQYHVSTVFSDAASGIIWVENQVLLETVETVLGKNKFDEWLNKQVTSGVYQAMM